MTARLILGDALEELPRLASASIDCVITDPPYPCIDRPYGYWTEAEWWALMMPVVAEVRRLLKPTGSAVFILQPNSEKVGRMRGWLWEFMAWVCREWNMVQDAWWWNPSSQPTIHCQRSRGGMRPSVKACVWAGEPDCYKDQSNVLWSESEANKAVDRSDRALQYHGSGSHFRQGRCSAVADERGGVTPFNLIPIANTDSVRSAGANGHGAGTPEALCSWWTRYLCPPEGAILDPFCGSGTTGISAVKRGCSYIGIERVPDYHAIAERRIAETERETATPLFSAALPSMDASLFDTIEDAL